MTKSFYLNEAILSAAILIPAEAERRLSGGWNLKQSDPYKRVVLISYGSSGG
jgi:hypothetical protein